MNEFEYDSRFAQAVAAGEQISADLMKRLGWVAKETGLTSGLVLEVLRAAARCPDQDGGADGGFLLYYKQDLENGRSVIPLFEVKCLGEFEDYTKFEVFGEGIKD